MTFFLSRREINNATNVIWNVIANKWHKPQSAQKRNIINPALIAQISTKNKKFLMI